MHSYENFKIYFIIPVVCCCCFCWCCCFRRMRCFDYAEGWGKIDFTWSIRNWMKYKNLYHIIDISCNTCEKHPTVDLFSLDYGYRPFIVVNTTSQTIKRQRRSINCTPGVSECCRDKLYISFAEIGWNDWILHPAGYDAYFCRGSCASAATITSDASNYHLFVRVSLSRGWLMPFFYVSARPLFLCIYSCLPIVLRFFLDLMLVCFIFIFILCILLCPPFFILYYCCFWSWPLCFIVFMQCVCPFHTHSFNGSRRVTETAYSVVIVHCFHFGWLIQRIRWNKFMDTHIFWNMPRVWFWFVCSVQKPNKKKFLMRTLLSRYKFNPMHTNTASHFVHSFTDWHTKNKIDQHTTRFLFQFCFICFCFFFFSFFHFF